MSSLKVCLLGKISLSQDDHTTLIIESKNVLELFCYLLLYRDRPHNREKLAGMIWREASTSHSKKNLRQSLWQLQSTIKLHENVSDNSILLVDPDWIQINPNADIELDVSTVEQTYALVLGKLGKNLDEQTIMALRHAVDLYKGDLMDGWYKDWCIYERERLRNMYLSILDKLIGYCEAHQKYDAGISFGERILRYDCARERTYRRMIRIYYLAGQRTTALRLYRRCETALMEELGVQPSKRTIALYEQIQRDQLDQRELNLYPITKTSLLPKFLNQLKSLRTVVANFQNQVADEILSIERILKDK